jgi:thiamine transport system permease protein
VASAVEENFLGDPMRRGLDLPTFIVRVTFLFLILFLLLPLCWLVVRSFQEGGVSGSFFRDAEFLSALSFTYSQAFASALLSGIVGSLCAWVFVESGGVFGKILWRVNLICFSVPTLLVALGIIGLWGNYEIYGWTGVLLGHCLLNIPIYFKWVGLALNSRDLQHERAALTLGASRAQTFFKVVFPKIRPILWESFLVTFLLSSSSFALVLMLGGGSRFQTLETLIFEATKIDLNLQRAVTLGSIQLFISAFLYAVLLWKVKIPFSAITTGTRENCQSFYFRDRAAEKLSQAFVYGLYTVLCVLPLVSFVILSLPGLKQWERDWFLAIWESAKLALSVGVVSSFLALGACYAIRDNQSLFLKTFIQWMVGIPLSLSSIILSLGFLLTWASWARTDWQTALGIVVVQSILALPLVFPPVHDAFSRLAGEVTRAARSLGASPSQVFLLVEIPCIRGGLITAFLMGTAFSLGEVGAVLVFHSSDSPTLSLYLQRLLGQYRFDEAFAVGTVLLFLMALLFGIGSRWEKAQN